MQILNDLHPEQKIPIYSWATEIEPGALDQAINLSQLPFAFHHIAIMPDVHQGYGMPIGGVLATEDVIVPNAVGVDIGCGMRTVRTGLQAQEIKPKVEQILAQILGTIPTGFKHHKQKQASKLFTKAPDVLIIRQELESAQCQLGTLGGGNHFIEIQKDKQDNVWLMVHSGSRNFGYQTAKCYHNKAKRWCERQGISLPDRDLAYLPLGSQDGQDYLTAMDYAQQFARENRRQMMDRIIQIINSQFPKFGSKYSNEIDIHHNYAVFEEHFGRRVLVHRKGAVNADVGKQMIVPGSMGSPSYVCLGLGNPDSFRTSAHGAGRRLGRKEAKRQIPSEQVYREMKQAGIALCKDRRQDVAEECKQAYKDIDAVMAAQADLVKIEVRLEPLGVVKG